MLVCRAVARPVTWLLALARTGCAGSPGSAPSELASPTTGSAAPAQTDCAPVELRTPAGERIDLTGAWGGGSTIHYLRQIGSCVWWEAVSNLPGAPLGSHWRRAFYGRLASDFTLSGEWAEVFNDPSFRPGGPESGWVEFQIVTETLGGEEEINTGGQVVDFYHAITLERVGPLPVGQ